MTVTLKEIDEKAVDLSVRLGVTPKFVFLDTKTLNELTQVFIPKERIVAEVGLSLSRIATGAGMLDVLEVKTEREIFEIV